jgi:type IV pilus assembly protein PilQ
MFAPLLWVMTTVAEAAVIENIAFTSRPDARLEVQLTFDEPPSADLESYTIEEPARIVVDLPQTRSALAEKHFSLSQPNTTSVMVLESGDRTRLIVNLVELVPFESQISGRRLTLRVGRDSREAAMSTAATDVLRTAANRVESVVSEITDLTFQRSPDGEGLLVLSLSNPAVDANIFSEGGKITLQFTDTAVREDVDPTLRRHGLCDARTKD